LTLPNYGAPLLPQLQNGRMVDGPVLNLTNQTPGIPAVPVNAQQPQQPQQQPPPQQSAPAGNQVK
jgi:hypothetical protein